ncbi:MAG TPA: hypothetical protein VMV00_00725 [Candidatus Baltobacteraceae bacterium]|nr:hypothetical protein [Candidatus Baltobacteraceae bacterium]
MEDNFTQLLKIVQTVEGAARPQEVNFVDTSGIGQQQAGAARPRYSEMLKTVFALESKLQLEMRQQGMHAPQQLKTQQEAQVQQERVTVAQKRVPQIRAPPMPNIRIGAAVSRGITAMEAEKQAVGRELGALVKGMGALESAVKSVTIKKIDTRSLVLPNLSVSDQIVELERIAQGLKENVFDQDQLSVIRQEVLGLNQVANEGKRQGDPLTAARDQRLREIMSMFNG